jgi:hypothetical protein
MGYRIKGKSSCMLCRFVTPPERNKAVRIFVDGYTEQNARSPKQQVLNKGLCVGHDSPGTRFDK